MSLLLRSSLFAGLLIAISTANVWGEDRPANTYFSLAVSDNSHNHYGENLLYLEFQDRPASRPSHSRIVRSVRVAGAGPHLDGDPGEWDPQLFTRVRGRVMNNYPLSEHYDAVPGELLIGSAFDDEYVYFILRFEDGNHDASIHRNRWVYDGGGWSTMKHAAPGKGTAADRTLNRFDDLAGNEDEDQIFIMFPIVDQQGNFKDGSLGCAGYCHANLVLSPDPARAQIGDGVSSMHTAVPDDIADLWHWTATRSRPMNTLKDGYLDYGDESYNGRKEDDGESPYEHNALMKPFRPRYVSRADYEAGNYLDPGFATENLKPGELLPITPDMEFAAGVSLPFYINVPPSGSRADVETAARFDSERFIWTVEFKRKRVTEDEYDHQFMPGASPPPPRIAMPLPGDPELGGKLYVEKSCASCHGENGEGRFENDRWIYPRNQRISAPAIRKTVSINRPKRLYSLAFQLKKYQEDPPEALMPFVPLTAQEAEHIAAWLQTRFTPRGE